MSMGYAVNKSFVASLYLVDILNTIEECDRDIEINETKSCLLLWNTYISANNSTSWSMTIGSIE